MERKILIADDDVAVHSVLNRLLAREGYRVLDAYDGGEVTTIALRETPDLIILDQMMPIKKGAEIYADLRSQYKTRMTPVIFLTGSSSQDDRIHGLSIGADDYLFKPFQVPELLARIDSVIKKSSAYLEANPLTQLPGNRAIEKRIMRCINEAHPFSVFYADINDFKAYNDRYGFLEGDAVIQKTGEMLVGLAQAHGHFVGHIGGDDFVVISESEDVESFARKITESFDRFCQPSNSAAGLCVAVGVVNSEVRALRTLADVSAVGAKVKNKAKQMKHSSFFIDQGGNGTES